MPTFETLGKSPEAYIKYVSAVYPDVPKLVPDYAQQLTTRDAGLLATLRCSRWSLSHKAVLCGDAVHGIVPFFGQGMNCGFESVVILRRFLQRHGVSTKERIASALAAYEAWHKPSGTAIADMAIENFTEMSYLVGLPEFMAKKHAETVIESRFKTKLRSRYHMVTRTLIPYALVQRAGPLVAAAVDEAEQFCKAHSVTIEQAPDDVLIKIIDKHFTPFIQKYKIDLSNPLQEFYPLPKLAAL